jgi:hypothetical protein
MSLGVTSDNDEPHWLDRPMISHLVNHPSSTLLEFKGLCISLGSNLRGSIVSHQASHSGLSDLVSLASHFRISSVQTND